MWQLNRQPEGNWAQKKTNKGEEKAMRWGRERRRIFEKEKKK